MMRLSVIGAVGATEVLKLKRSAVVPATLAVSVLLPAMVGFFFWMLMHPGVAEGLGLLGQKARVALGGQSLDGATFLPLVVEIAGLGGLFLSAVTVTFVFGREYAEGTAKVLYTLPVPRIWFVLVKLAVSALWFAGLVTVMGLSAWGASALVGIPGMGAGLWAGAAAKMAVLTLLVAACSPLVAWAAVAGRGYFAPLGFAVFTLVLASVFGRTGWGPWVPWSLVGLEAGMAGPDQVLGWVNYLVSALWFAAGTVLTVVHEVRADNRQ